MGVGPVRYAGCMSQQVGDSDAALGGDDVDTAGRGLHGHAGLRERGNKIAHRFVDGELAFFHQGQYGSARERFGLRRDPEDGVRSHLTPCFLVGPTEGAFVCRLPVLEHESDDPGDAVIVDVFLKDTVNALETRRGYGEIGFRRRLPMGAKRQGQKYK